MQLAQIIAELEGAAQQEAAGIHVLETTLFEPELGLVADRCIATARARADALAQAARRLRVLMQGEFTYGEPRAARKVVVA